MEANTHKPECYINQNWDEALQALADTPNEFRDAEYYAAVEDINSKRTKCTCNTQQFKVGDTVRIREDLEVGKNYSGVTIDEDSEAMQCCIGCEGEVYEIDDYDNTIYVVSGNDKGVGFWYSLEMLEPMPSNQPTDRPAAVWSVEKEGDHLIITNGEKKFYQPTQTIFPACDIADELNNLQTENIWLRSMVKPHYFNAPDEDKGSRFCRCGKYLTDKIHYQKHSHEQR